MGSNRTPLYLPAYGCDPHSKAPQQRRAFDPSPTAQATSSDHEAWVSKALFLQRGAYRNAHDYPCQEEKD